MAKVMAIVNQKGGVGKTTTSVNLSAALGDRGKRVLLVDIDPQGNATSGVGIDKRSVQTSTYELMTGDARPEQTVVHTAFRNLDVLPASIQLAGAEIEMVEMTRRESRLKAALAALREPDWPAKACPLIAAQRAVLTADLTALGLTVCPSQANYLLFRGPAGLDTALLRQKIAIRSCANYPGLGEGWYRTAVRLPEENEALLDALRRGMEKLSWR